MATSLKKTGVVVVGMGGAGGLAALPLARAGIDVIGLEAGSWLKTSDMIPDELGLRRSPWPPGPQKVRGEAPTTRANATANATRAAAASFRENENKISLFVGEKMQQRERGVRPLVPSFLR